MPKEIQKTVWFADNRVWMIDQTRLPFELVIVSYNDYNAVALAIENMVVRGAPAIGVAAAMGIALGCLQVKTKGRLQQDFPEIVARIRETRPTAVNLFWACRQMQDVYAAVENLSLADIQQAMIGEVLRLEQEDIDKNQKMGEYGAVLIPDGGRIITHCNAGALATVAWGTALGVLRSAWVKGKRFEVFADETRPRLQGGRLTAWELHREGIPVTVICDNMAGWLMQKKKIDLVIVGADRIAANGDTANKIGTYSLAVLARENGVPFYIVAPLATIDCKLLNGNQIPIEERSSTEVTDIDGVRIIAPEVSVWNPGFDVTPSRYITGIITERGILSPPFQKSIKEVYDVK